MKINNVTCFYDNWDTLKEAIHIKVVTSDNIWRGQSNGKWKLCSSLFRFFKKMNITQYRRPFLEKCAIEFFKNNLDKNKNNSDLYNLKDYSYCDLLVLMQHFGCPTRLIDFSKSPYVALYFAISESSSISALYSLDLDFYLNILKEKKIIIDKDFNLSFDLSEKYQDFLQKNRNCKYPIPISAKIQSERDFTQQSIYLFDMDITQNTENILLKLSTNYFEEYGQELFSKLEFPSEIKNEIFKDLALMNLDGFHLFKGLQGLAYKAKDILQVPEADINLINSV